MDRLATTEDFLWSQGRVDDPTDLRVIRALEDASAYFRSKSTQHISLVVDDVQELRGNWSPELWLPQRPVIEVESLEVRYPGESTYRTLTGVVATRRGLIPYPGTYLEDCPGGHWGGPLATIIATYTHGYATIPPDVVAQVVSMAQRFHTNPMNVTQRSIGSFSESFGDATVGVTSDEQSVIARYRDAALEGAR